MIETHNLSDTIIEEVPAAGCGRELADGQYWVWCGDHDIDSAPALCTECGGTYKLKES